MDKSAPVTLEMVTSEIDRIFELQQQNQYKVGNTTVKERRAKLKKLEKALMETYKADIIQAGYDDFRKHEAEVMLTEIFPAITAIRHTSKNLGKWMRDEKVATPMAMFGFSSKIKYEPKGVVLIISPWNFAFNLSFIPLVAAIAAGNTVILKPSENTPNSARLIAKIINDLYDESEVAAIQGGVPETTELLKKPFNHIFFTGAPSIGKVVMKAAAEHLTSVSLELGGKSPTIVDETADVAAAAERIAWAKSMNNGQICIAPDYVYVHESVKEKFVTEYKKAITAMYGDNPKENDSYNRIVNDRHFRRLSSYMEDAVERNAKIEMGGQMDEKENYVAPTVVSNLGDDALLWREEIFGPILPIRTFTDIKEPVGYIQKGEKPLGLYVYSKNQQNIDYVNNNTRSGAIVVNYSATQYSNPNLPFGGSNNSGIGKGNGIFGFKAFSNAKGVQNHWAPIDGMKGFYPPYNKDKVGLIEKVVKWFA